MIRDLKLKKLMSDTSISDEDKLEEIERREVELDPRNTSALVGLIKAKAKLKKLEK